MLWYREVDMSISGTGSCTKGNVRIMFWQKIKSHVAIFTKELKSTAVILVVHKF